MIRIDSFYFGNIIVNGRKFQQDIILSSNGEITEKEGNHSFGKKEYNDILMRNPEVIILGTGTVPNVRIDPDIEVTAKLNGIEIITKPTIQAVEEFNKLVNKKRVVAVMHVTC